MRRTLTMAAAVAALLLPAGAVTGAEAAAGGSPAGEAQAYWTPERMASAAPLPPPEPAPSPTPPPTPAPTPPPVRRPAAAAPGVGQNFDGIPVVGRMFVVKGAGAYFCTASVVASPGRNLVLSAAHCLLGADSKRVAFVPRYTRAKPQPYGMFPVLRDAAGRSRIWIDPRYRSQGPDRAAALDVAFAQVGPNAAGVPVQSVVGGNRLVTGAGYAHPQVRLIGHPSSAARPRLCVNRTTKFTSKDARIPGSFLRIACTGYPGGTSGGPFLARYDARTRTGDVIGVIGGWKTGGDTADTSYSSYFGSDVRKLYAKAVAGAKAG
ncbi:trypsin-like peptidase domain-containing protein [Streptomyces sp. IBSNAI002]|uniref:trypsin-like peptidase domain-containing protein n=1 Tax=Streptomyces sp. IBSNAI002 TaxID=3457500 RepID=UPI003FD44C9D